MARRHSFGRLLGALLVALPLLTACDNEMVNPPNAVNALFNRYVALGNSLTAGFQSGGINDSTQLQSYAVVLAQQFQTDFNVPLLNKPGCPPPLTNIFTQETLGGPMAPPCALRTAPIPERINNVAVPGAAIIDILTNTDADSDPNALTSFILGGRTQLEVAAAAQPTFVSIAIGSNDILGALLNGANPGDPALVTDPATFATRYGNMLDQLEALGTIQGGVLIGLQPLFVDATTLSAAYFTPGAAWQQFELFFDGQTPFNFFDVNPACATAFVPFPVGGAILAEANAKVDSVQTGLLDPFSVVPSALDCTDAQAITAAEFGNVAAAQAQYNAAIEAEATARGWAYLDPAAVFTGLAMTPGAFRPFPAFDSADPQHETQPFGFALSIDGIHWSATLHDAIADAVIAAINAEYGTSVTTP
jgi:lysophospholipase L1-like esterase